MYVMFIPLMNVDLFRNDKDVDNLIKGKNLKQAANSIAEAYGQEIKSFGIDNTSKFQSMNCQFIFVTLQNGVTIRVFKDKNEYAKKVLRVK